MVDKPAEEVIENIDEEKVLEMIDAESKMESSRSNSNRVQKKLLDELGLFDVDLEEFNLSDELVNRIRYLEYVNMESNEQVEASEEAKEEVRERLHELGFELPDDN